jgi:dTDP-4-dehydrorhamnose reductase
LKILLTGKRGQIGSALLVTLPRLGELIAVDRSQLDLTKIDSVRETVRDIRPHVIVNAAAYTAVDEAEREQAAAFCANRDAPATLAEEALSLGALLVHFSTDYVFDGHKRAPYVENDSTNPLNVYGRSKLAGEEAIVSSGCRHLILRTSWVYAERGKNFLVTIRRLMNHGKELRVVDDQWGAPTSASMIARAVPSALKRVIADESLEGLYHMTAAGSTTWCRFARSIVGKDVTAISSDAYQTAARRPLYSVLDNTKLNMRLNVRLASWEEGLKETLKR